MRACVLFVQVCVFLVDSVYLNWMLVCMLCVLFSSTHLRSFRSIRLVDGITVHFANLDFDNYRMTKIIKLILPCPGVYLRTIDVWCDLADSGVYVGRS